MRPVETAETLKRKIETAEDLRSVVRTIKALAAVSIQHYEKALDALVDYTRAVEEGLHIVLRGKADGAVRVKAKPAPRNSLIAILIGSEQGLCGQFNEQVVSYATDSLGGPMNDVDRRAVFALGTRAAQCIEDAGLQIDEGFALPSRVSGITPLVEDLLTKIEEWRARLGVDLVVAFHHRLLSNTTFAPRMVQLLPLDSEWLAGFSRKAWPCRTVPMFTMEWDRIFSALVWQYLFISVYRAVAESLAGENAARLTAMQGAEKNIELRVEDLNREYHQHRQASITEELLEIVAGFEALTSQK